MERPNQMVMAPTGEVTFRLVTLPGVNPAAAPSAYFSKARDMTTRWIWLVPS